MRERSDPLLSRARSISACSDGAARCDGCAPPDRAVAGAGDSAIAEAAAAAMSAASRFSTCGVVGEHGAPSTARSSAGVPVPVPPSFDVVVGGRTVIVALIGWGAGAGRFGRQGPPVTLYAPGPGVVAAGGSAHRGSLNCMLTAANAAVWLSTGEPGRITSDPCAKYAPGPGVCVAAAGGGTKRGMVEALKRGPLVLLPPSNDVGIGGPARASGGGL